MGLSEVMFLNKLPLKTYTTQMELNYNIADFNNIQQNTIIYV
jgi:hypothetical protein